MWRCSDRTSCLRDSRVSAKGSVVVSLASHPLQALVRRPYDCHCFDSSCRSKSADAATPASSAQKAELMLRIANGVTATMNATRAPKRSGPEKLFSNESCNAPRIARPASAKTYDLGSTPTSAAIVVPAKAISNVSNAEMTTPQY